MEQWEPLPKVDLGRAPEIAVACVIAFAALFVAVGYALCALRW